jgi:hypothetical protein
MSYLRGRVKHPACTPTALGPLCRGDILREYAHDRSSPQHHDRRPGAPSRSSTRTWFARCWPAIRTVRWLEQSCCRQLIQPCSKSTSYRPGYTKADFCPTAIGDGPRVADRVRCAGYSDRAHALAAAGWLLAVRKRRTRRASLRRRGCVTRRRGRKCRAVRVDQVQGHQRRVLVIPVPGRPAPLNIR